MIVYYLLILRYIQSLHAQICLAIYMLYSGLYMHVCLMGVGYCHYQCGDNFLNLYFLFLHEALRVPIYLGSLPILES